MHYEDKSYIDSNSVKPSINFSPRSIMAIIVATIAITIFVGNFFITNTVKQNRSVSIAPKKVRELENKIDVVPVKPIINNQINPVTENIAGITNLKPKLVEPKVIIPKYTVERVDILSDAFDQGKVYVTIDEKSSNESQRLLCKELVKRYSEFSNIVICLYANNRSGKDLARGNDKNVSVEEQKRFWLAMYTYNSVEGEYFDNYPSGYLGI